MALIKLDNGQADPGLVTTLTTPPGPPSASPTTPVYTPSAAAPPPVTQTPGPDAITTTPGYTPDYTAAIQSDPGYTAAAAANAKAKSEADAARQAAVRAAYIKYGGDMPGFKDAYGDIDQATKDAAAGNQYSTLASLKHNYDQSVENFRRALAARGALQSGDLNYGQSELDRGYGQAQYDAGNAFGSDYAGAINQYTGVLDANDQNMVSAINGAESNAYADPLNRPVTAKTAVRDTGMSSQYGIDIYKGDDGTYYTLDGTPWTPPDASASASATPYGGGGVYTPYVPTTESDPYSNPRTPGFQL